jgi:hypothetical protein
MHTRLVMCILQATAVCAVVTATHTVSSSTLMCRDNLLNAIRTVSTVVTPRTIITVRTVLTFVAGIAVGAVGAVRRIDAAGAVSATRAVCNRTMISRDHIIERKEERERRI